MPRTRRRACGTRRTGATSGRPLTLKTTGAKSQATRECIREHVRIRRRYCPPGATYAPSSRGRGAARWVILPASFWPCRDRDRSGEQYQEDRVQQMLVVRQRGQAVASPSLLPVPDLAGPEPKGMEESRESVLWKHPRAPSVRTLFQNDKATDLLAGSPGWGNGVPDDPGGGGGRHARDYLRKRNMYKAPVCFLLCRNPSPCAASLAGGSKPSSLSIFYESWHRASFMIFQPKFYRGCYKIICLNSLHSPSQRNINGDLSLPLMFRNRGRFIQTTKWRGNHGITESLFLPLILQT
jgi:hypothetical protein